jgi:hypothetical protein
MINERIEKMNDWIKTTTSIGTETVSQEVEGDYLTQWDEDSYHVVNYVDGRVDKTLITSKRPSVMLKHIEKVFNDWSMELNINAMDSLKRVAVSLRNTFDRKVFTPRFIFGDCWITVYMNDIHKDMISDDAFNNWYKYKDGILDIKGKSVTLEEWIASVILKEAKKYPNDIQLQRSIKLKALL